MSPTRLSHELNELAKTVPIKELVRVANTAIIASSLTTAVGLIAIPFFLAVMVQGWRHRR